MPSLAALFTSDPFLVRCELHRVRNQFSLGDPTGVVGVGAYEDSVVLLKRYGSGVPRTDLWEAPETDVVLLHSQAPTSATPLEENTQPFRLRQWLFAHAGDVDQADRVRERILKTLPDFLLRAIRGTTVSEAIFAVYLGHLRELGYALMDPDDGALAAGEGSGPGRMPEPQTIFAYIGRVLERASERGSAGSGHHGGRHRRRSRSEDSTVGRTITR